MQEKNKDLIEIPNVQLANQDNATSVKEDELPTSAAIGSNIDMSKYVRPRKTRTIIRENIKKIGRNDPCPCGSGKKYKNCCLKEGNDWNTTRELTAQEMAKVKYGTSQPQDFKH